VWSTRAPAAPPLELGPIADDIRHLLFMPDGAHLISGGDDGRVLGWDVVGGVVAPASRTPLLEHGAAISSLRLGADRRSLVAVGRDRVAHTLVIGAAPVRDRTAPAPGPVVVLPGERLATGQPDGSIVVHTLAPRTFADLQASLR
jgi:hypothetical protein